MQRKQSNRSNLNRPTLPTGPMKTVEGEQLAYKSVRNRTKPLRLNKRDVPAIKILSSLTLPKESPPVRIGSAYGSDPTATANLFRRLDALFPGVDGSSDIPAGDSAAFFFRDALRAMIYNFGLLPSDQFQYTAQAILEISTSTNSAFPRYTGPLEVDLAYSTVAPHGQFLFLGRNGKTDQNRGILAQGGSELIITVPIIPALGSANVQFTVFKFEADTWVEQTAVVIPAASGGTVNYSTPETGYYSWDAACTTPSAGGATPATLQVTMQTNATTASLASCWAQLPLPNLEEVLPTVRAIRVIAVSGMYTNTSAPINRQGQITALQIPKTSNWIDYTDFDVVASLMKSQTLNVVNGMYGFLKPTSADDFEMQSFQFSSGTSLVVTDYVFDLIPDSDFLTIHPQISSTAPLQTGYWTPAYAVEYTSTTQWIELRASEASNSDLENALGLLPSVPQWHENDFHFSDIWDWIKDTASSIWGGVKEVAGTVGPVIGAVAPFLI